MIYTVVKSFKNDLICVMFCCNFVVVFVVVFVKKIFVFFFKPFCCWLVEIVLVFVLFLFFKRFIFF